MQTSQGSGSGSEYTAEPSNAQNGNGQYYPHPTTLFPVTGSRAAGTHPLNSAQTTPTIAHGLTQAEIDRHQRPAHITGTEAQGKDYQAGFFPIPGNKWAWPSNTSQNRPGEANKSDFVTNSNGNGKGSGNGDYQSQAESRSQSHPQTSFDHSAQSAQAQPPTGVNMDSISAFLSEMPTQAEDPTRHVMWTELIRLKTRTLELQIAEARRKEKEAELEILRLKAGAATKSENMENSLMRDAGSHGPSATASSANVDDPNNGHYAMLHQNINADPSSAVNMNMSHQQEHTTNNNMFTNTQPMTPFDLEAMLSSENMDNFLSWLPDLGDHPLPEILPLAPTTDYGNASTDTNNHLPYSTHPVDTFLPQHNSHQPPISFDENQVMQSQLQSPTRRRSASAEEQSPKQSGPPSKKRRGTEKKVVVEHSTSCSMCRKILCRVMIRSPKSTMPDPIKIEVRCTDCVPIDQPSTLPDSTNGHSIGTVETRKRMRVQMEIDDEENKVRDRRQWCDVCQRIVGSGQVIGGKGKDQESIGGIAEIICGDCDGKYQRCTDCGGGGGPRVGIGKWRMKQVFHPGRKTCSLNHIRLGDRTRELGVHVTPTDFSPEQIKEVLTRCKALWNEKTLARLAVPEMLEVDLPAGLGNPLRDFADVDDMVVRNWPSREAMIKANDLDPNRFRRLLSLIWSHSKPRRTVRTVDLEEEWIRPEDNDDDLSTVLANVKKTNVVIPPGSELIGMWGGEWNMHNGSLLISTFIPFEGADGEDSTALCVGEMITKVQSLQQEINAERTQRAKLVGGEAELLPPCEHLWTVSGGYIPLVRERFADILIRKRSFVHVEEYLTRHPEFIESIKARPVGLHPDIHRPTEHQHPENQPGKEGGNSGQGDGQGAKPLILVRWLGKEFDAAKILEIKQMEFGGGPKKKKKKA
ncbi:uncharacterized protein I303_106397 [Kwoniella dejecticola CBS 10117]|uniref:Uncharacterized protein n=1 Tax=Kwoniella dejecticola CBS 10117 TaxID=1296121 RepID=A0A1A5ZUU4_9TREE|nr:uncharacterized protein I303_08344 [Kwoniella dejecticola CBS 10117]OBR81574.1 hypothetical protein I303_08344 [Kwoniella dejecticola CBS 10117]